MRRKVQRCPCGGGLYARCCRPYLQGVRPAPTAEALMRSRYTAFARNAIDYLMQTHDPQTVGDLERADLADFAARARWQGLVVHGAQDTPDGARVQFTALFFADGAERAIDEDSRFRQLANGRWVYVDGRPRGG